MLLPNLRLLALNIQSIMTTIEEPEGNENQAACSAPSSSISMEGLTTIPNTIREMLKHEMRYTTIAARKLLVPLADLSQAYVVSLLTISKIYAGCLLFQAEVDKLYVTQGVSLQEYGQTQSHMPKDSVTFAVGFIYSDDNIGHLPGKPKSALLTEIQGGRRLCICNEVTDPEA